MSKKDFVYVDTTHVVNDQNRPWVRMHVDMLDNFQYKTAKNINCFATIQKFASSVQSDDEDYIAPLWFDLDAKDDVESARLSMVKIVEFFLGLDIKEEQMRISFSGRRGYHLLIADKAFDIKPAKDLHKVYKHIAGYLIYKIDKQLLLKTVDLNVYNNRRMLRLDNSVHGSTNLYKYELTYDELKELTSEQIMELAKSPRHKPIYTDTQLKLENRKRQAAINFFEQHEKQYREIAALQESSSSTEFIFSHDKMPVCVEDIYKNGWKKDGDRNQATVQLACYFKEAGYTEEEARDLLCDWVKRFTSAIGDYELGVRLSSTSNVVRAVYGGSYKFGCALIRSLHGPKPVDEEEDYDRVPCAGTLCPCIKRNEAVGDATDLHLSNTGSASYSGKLVRTKVMVAGKKQTPYIVPSKIEYKCYSKCKKVGCPLYNIPNRTAYKELTSQNRELIQMCGIGDDNIKAVLRGLSGVNACIKFEYTILGTVNMEELLVIPMTDTTERLDSTSKYVIRKVYSMGDLNITENKYYEIEGFVYPHPKNQESTILINAIKPLQDVIDSFVVTDEILSDLKVFQPVEETDKGINVKLEEIINDLTCNVTKIIERDEVLLGLLLTYHSALRIKAPWDTTPIRGWLELIVVGDTGTGKSALIEKLMNHCGLGSRVNAESTSRTGLTYKMEQHGTGSWFIQWGAWPLADKEFIWVDEASAIPKEEYGQMTLARSDGKLEVKRAVTAETSCRVRAVLSGNVPKGKRLADYTQGCASLKDIFNNEDIRRFDFGVFMKAIDVDTSKYNLKIPSCEQKITKNVLKNSVLFAWSRTPDDIILPEETVTSILETSSKLSALYGKATDVPLVSPSDERNKILRLATALAVLLHSVNEDLKVVVKVPHVEYIYLYLKSLYNASACGLNYYTKLAVNEDTITDDQFTKLRQFLSENCPSLKHDTDFANFIDIFAKQNYLHAGDIEAMLNLSKEDSKTLIQALVKARMLVKTTAGYKKTARFNAFIEKCFVIGMFDDEDNLI